MHSTHPVLFNTMTAHAKRRGQRLAATLLEMSIWLLIFVGIIGATLMIASSVLTQNTASQETQTLTTLSAEIRKVKTSRGYTATIEDDLRSMGTIPSSVTDTGTGLFNSWGGTITFAQVDSGANFSISYTNIPKAECIQLANSVRAGVLQSIGNGTAADTNIVDLTPSLIDTDICQDAGNNDVTWSSKVQ